MKTPRALLLLLIAAVCGIPLGGLRARADSSGGDCALETYLRAYQRFQAQDSPGGNEALQCSSSLSDSLLDLPAPQYISRLHAIEALSSQSPDAIADLAFRLQLRWENRYLNTVYKSIGDRESQDQLAQDVLLVFAFPVASGMRGISTLRELARNPGYLGALSNAYTGPVGAYIGKKAMQDDDRIPPPPLSLLHLAESSQMSPFADMIQALQQNRMLSQAGALLSSMGAMKSLSFLMDFVKTPPQLRLPGMAMSLLATVGISERVESQLSMILREGRAAWERREVAAEQGRLADELQRMEKLRAGGTRPPPRATDKLLEAGTQALHTALKLVMLQTAPLPELALQYNADHDDESFKNTVRQEVSSRHWNINKRVATQLGLEASAEEAARIRAQWARKASQGRLETDPDALLFQVSAYFQSFSHPILSLYAEQDLELRAKQLAVVIEQDGTP